jgi:hypothetical protein
MPDGQDDVQDTIQAPEFEEIKYVIGDNTSGSLTPSASHGRKSISHVDVDFARRFRTESYKSYDPTDCADICNTTVDQTMTDVPSILLSTTIDNVLTIDRPAERQERTSNLLHPSDALMAIHEIRSASIGSINAVGKYIHMYVLTNNLTSRPYVAVLSCAMIKHCCTNNPHYTYTILCGCV